MPKNLSTLGLYGAVLATGLLSGALLLESVKRRAALPAQVHDLSTQARYDDRSKMPKWNGAAFEPKP